MATSVACAADDVTTLGIGERHPCSFGIAGAGRCAGVGRREAVIVLSQRGGDNSTEFRIKKGVEVKVSATGIRCAGNTTEVGTRCNGLVSPLTRGKVLQGLPSGEDDDSITSPPALTTTRPPPPICLKDCFHGTGLCRGTVRSGLVFCEHPGSSGECPTRGDILCPEVPPICSVPCDFGSDLNRCRVALASRGGAILCSASSLNGRCPVEGDVLCPTSTGMPDLTSASVVPSVTSKATTSYGTKATSTDSTSVGETSTAPLPGTAAGSGGENNTNALIAIAGGLAGLVIIAVVVVVVIVRPGRREGYKPSGSRAREPFGSLNRSMQMRPITAPTFESSELTGRSSVHDETSFNADGAASVFMKKGNKKRESVRSSGYLDVSPDEEAENYAEMVLPEEPENYVDTELPPLPEPEAPVVQVSRHLPATAVVGSMKHKTLNAAVTVSNPAFTTDEEYGRMDHGRASDGTYDENYEMPILAAGNQNSNYGMFSEEAPPPDIDRATKMGGATGVPSAGMINAE